MVKLPPQLKPLTPFVKRALELDRASGDRERMMSYFCRSYAMELGIKLNDNSAPVKAVLLGLMEQLEKDKANLPSYSGKEEAKQFVEGFAFEVFKKADDKDRAGLADKSTARTFYAADTFFQILKQFDDNRELDPDVKQTSLYAKWKATDILKALREGRKPTPGPPGGDEDDSNVGGGGGGLADSIPPAPSDSAIPAPAPEPQPSLYDIPAVPSEVSQPSSIGAEDPDAALAAQLAAQLADATPPTGTTPPPASAATPPPSYQAPAPAAAPAAAPTNSGGSIFSKIGGFLGGGRGSHEPKLNEDEQHDALEWSQYAVRAIQTEQYARAIECMQKSLQILGASPHTQANHQMRY